MEEAMQAQNNPQLRKDFFAKSLNVFTSAMEAYFDMAVVRASDARYNWSLEELAKLQSGGMEAPTCQRCMTLPG